jgi:hypothetical protein
MLKYTEIIKTGLKIKKETEMENKKVPCYFKDKIVGYSIMKDGKFTTTIFFDKELSEFLIKSQKVSCSAVGFNFEEDENSTFIYEKGISIEGDCK